MSQALDVAREEIRDGRNWMFGFVHLVRFAQDRHFVRAFLGREEPLLTWDDGVDVVRLLMTAYQSAEQGKTLFISSHILTELEEMCDHVGIVERGRLVFSGTMEWPMRTGNCSPTRALPGGSRRRFHEGAMVLL